MRREVIAVVGENKGIIHARRCREGDRRGGWRELDEKILIAHGGIVFLGYPFEVCWEGEEKREREREELGVSPLGSEAVYSGSRWEQDLTIIFPLESASLLKKSQNGIV